MSQITCSFTVALGGRTEIGNALYLLVAGVTSRLTIASPPAPFNRKKGMVSICSTSTNRYL